MIVCLAIFVSGLFSDTSYHSIRHTQIVNSKFVLLDTIIINDPALIEFKEKPIQVGNKTQWLLVPKSDSMKIRRIDSFIKFKDFYFFNNSFLLFTPAKFYCILSQLNKTDYSQSDSNIYRELKFNLLNAEKDTIYVVEKSTNNVKILSGWNYYDIKPHKFLLFNVRGDILRKCQSIDEILIEDNPHVYYKVLTPLLW
jgi:hypothetical protein